MNLTIIEVENFPTLEEYAQENSLMAKRLSPIIKTLNDKCNSLKNKLVEASKDPPGSPIKASASNPQTPRRKPLRELPSRDSAKKKQQQAQAAPQSLLSVTENQDEDVDMEPPETPTKKRKLGITTLITAPIHSKKAATASTVRQIFPPPPCTPITPRVQVRNILTSPSTSTVKSTLPSNPSPLRRSARNLLQDEVENEDSMEVDEDDVLDTNPRKLNLNPKSVNKSSQMHRMEEEEVQGVVPVIMKRYRPVYQDWKQ